MNSTAALKSMGELMCPKVLVPCLERVLGGPPSFHVERKR